MGLNCIGCSLLRRGGACVKGMDTDVTVLKRHPYISPGKHSGEHPVGVNGLREAEVPAQERRLNKGCVGGLLYSVCSPSRALSQVFPQLPTHTCSHKPALLDTPNHHEVACLPCMPVNCNFAHVDSKMM